MTAVASVRFALAQIPFLAELSPAELDELSEKLRRRRYRKGEVIFAQGDPGTTLYLVESGRVRIALTSSQGKEKILALRGVGDFFGEQALLDGEPRSADAVAHEPTGLLLLQRPDFTRFLEARPKLAVRLLAALSRRLRHSTQMVQDASFLDIPGRLARVLLDLAESEGRATDEGLVITSRLSQAELAALAGATRESINKWLGFYERQGLIRRDRDRITVVKPQQLRRRIY
jgi:CRP/FNR family transcriptional regulator, cyclic AMP receptor protein